jgi:hypothetical protein
MANQPSLSNEDRANLVAYLDGELNAAAARTLEIKLQQDPRARAEADSLRRTWDMLDYLPRPEPSATFSSRTIERVSAYRPAARVARRRWAMAAGCAAALVLASVAGFGSGRLVPHPVPARSLAAGADAEAQLAGDRRLLENMLRYRHVDDFDFLRQLAEPKDPDLFGDGPPAGPVTTARPPDKAVDDAGLDAHLLAGLGAFRALPHERQETLRRLDD